MSFIDTDNNGLVKSESYGYTVDDLDTKQIEDAVCRFEKMFICIREALLDREGVDSLDDSELDKCHHIARYLTRNFGKFEN